MKIIIAIACFLLASEQVLASQAPEGKVLIPAGMAVVGTDASELPKQLPNKNVKIEWYSDETPQRKVQTGAFLMDITEVTNERYAMFEAKHIFPQNMAVHPVVNVTFDKAAEFCKFAGGRLPTAAEWERAARGDDGKIYPWGNVFQGGDAVFAGVAMRPGENAKVGNFDIGQSQENLLGGTRPVGSIEAGKSQFGAYDMAGNVWEWVSDWYDEKKKLRMLKGGSWLSPASSLRSATRLGDTGETRANDYGFRCAYDTEK